MHSIWRRTSTQVAAISFLLIAILVASQSALAGSVQRIQEPIGMRHTQQVSNYIQHILYIVKNRSFDNLFGAYATAQNDVNGSRYAAQWRDRAHGNRTR